MTTRHPHPLIQQLRQARLEQGLPVRAVAARMHCTTGTVHNYERGWRRPHAAQLAAYAEAIGYRLTLTPINTQELS